MTEIWLHLARERMREISSVWEAKLRPATERVQGGQVSEGHRGQEVLKVARVLLLNVWAVK